jgi:hypothetical protein
MSIEVANRHPSLENPSETPIFQACPLRDDMYMTQHQIQNPTAANFGNAAAPKYERHIFSCPLVKQELHTTVLNIAIPRHMDVKTEETILCISNIDMAEK